MIRNFPDQTSECRRAPEGLDAQLLVACLEALDCHYVSRQLELDIDTAARHSQNFRFRAGMRNALFHNLLNIADEVADVLFLDVEWRNSREHRKVASA